MNHDDDLPPITPDEFPPELQDALRRMSDRGPVVNLTTGERVAQDGRLTTDRCGAAHHDDRTPCDGPPVVTVLDADGAGADGCEHHAARLLSSLEGGRVYGLPDAPEGAAIRVFKAADTTRPFAWYDSTPRTRPDQLSRAENRGEAAGPNVETGEGFDAPAPDEAYEHAPELLRESAELLRLSTSRAVGDLDDDDHAERLYLLRRAALADRMALDAARLDTRDGGELYRRDAVDTAQALLQFDIAHPEFAPVSTEGPDSPMWLPSARPYVRACYSGWGWE